MHPLRRESLTTNMVATMDIVAVTAQLESNSSVHRCSTE